MMIPAIEMVQVPATEPAWVSLVSGVGLGVAPAQRQLAEVTHDGLRQEPV